MGLIIVAGAQLAFALQNVFIERMDRAMGPDRAMPILEVLVVRMVITYLGACSIMLVRGVTYPFSGPPDMRYLLVARGVFGFCGLHAIYYSLGYMTLSDSTALTYLTPSMTGLLGHFFLGEPFTRRELLAGFFSLLGVILIVEPSVLFGGERLGLDRQANVDWGIGKRSIAVSVGLLGVGGAAAAYTTISAIGRRTHALHMVAYFAGASAVASFLGMIIFRVPFVFPPTFLILFYLVASGFLGFVGQCLLSTGLQGEKAGRGSLVMYLQIIFSGLVDRLAFVHPHYISFPAFVGSALVLGSAIFGTFGAPAPSFLIALLAKHLPAAASSYLPLYTQQPLQTTPPMSPLSFPHSLRNGTGDPSATATAPMGRTRSGSLSDKLKGALRFSGGGAKWTASTATPNGGAADLPGGGGAGNGTGGSMNGRPE